MFTVHNVKRGWSTNSSSAHSIVFLASAKDRNALRKKGSEPWGQEFGWDWFVLDSPDTKRAYAAQQLASFLQTQPGQGAFAAEVVKARLGVNLEKSGYVDHQSAITFPVDAETGSFSREFFDDFVACLMREDAVVIGGNDNSETPSWVPSSDFKLALPLPRDNPNEKILCRKDGSGVWILFNTRDGSRSFIDFRDPTKACAPKNTTLPCLLDVKITNFCPYNCAYCYQGSTAKEPNVNHRDRILRVAHALRPFEIAIGGGDPSFAVGIGGTVSMLAGVEKTAVCVTTRNLGWLMTLAASRPSILDCVKAFAYSVDDSADIEKLAQCVATQSNLRGKLSVHYVVGVGRESDLEGVMRAAAEHEFPLVLLGYKTTGRGSLVTPSHVDWLAVYKRLTKDGVYPTISIDTALAASSAKQLARAGVSPKTYFTADGRFSAYFDAVANKLGPSSYCDPAEMIDVSERDPVDAWREISTRV